MRAGSQMLVRIRARSVAHVVAAALLGAATLAAGVAPARAQQTPVRTVTGRVVDASSGRPLAGASVFVPTGHSNQVGPTYGVVTDAEGTFTLSIPETDKLIAVQMIGYAEKEVTLKQGQASVLVGLQTEAVNLGQIVVTGQATGVRRSNLANDVATVNSNQINIVPTANVMTGLAGQISGANIQTNSGAPGGGAQVQLRGVSTIIGNSTPLYVVDGVIVSDATIESGANSLTQAGGGVSNVQDNAPGRIADLDPSDIQSIQVLKGPSAAAIYGSLANNGVIIITTKRGRPGATRYHLTERLGVPQISKELGSRSFNLTSALSNYCGSSPSASCASQIGSYFGPNGLPLHTYNQEAAIAGRSPLSDETELSVSGGNDRSTYYLDGLLQNDGGIVNNTFYKKKSLAMSLSQVIGSRFHFSVNANVLRTQTDDGFTNNDNTGTAYFVALSGTPNFVDLGRLKNGAFPDNPFQPSNPLQTAAQAINDEQVFRFIGSVHATMDALRTQTQQLQFVLTGGADDFDQTNLIYAPQTLQYEQTQGLPGLSVHSNGLDKNYNVTLSAVHTWTPTSGLFQATSSLGGSYFSTSLDETRSLTQNLFPGQLNAGAGAVARPSEDRSLLKRQSAYAQEQVLFRQRLLVTVGLVTDRTSADANVHQWFYYPKAAASYRFTLNAGPLSTLKLRAAFGQTGNEPLYGQKYNALGVGSIGGLQTLTVGGTVAANNLQPERKSEIEGGFDATFWGGRAVLSVTPYYDWVTNLLLDRSLASSTGYGTEIFNSNGRLSDRGVDVGLDVDPVHTGTFDWRAHLSFSLDRSRIDSLDVPAFEPPNAGFGFSLGNGYIQQGKSPTQIVGLFTSSHANDPRCLASLHVTAASGQCPAGTTFLTALGNSNPDFTVGWFNTLQYRSFALSSTLNWQQGGNVVNLTQLLYDLNGNTSDYNTPCHLAGCKPGQTMGPYRVSQLGLSAAPYVESASFLNLQEVALTYTVPHTLLRQLSMGGVQQLQLTASGENLLMLSPYKGYSPMVNNFGNEAIRANIDVSPYPPHRTFWFSADVTF